MNCIQKTTHHLASVLLISLLVFPGCVNLKRKYPDVRTYSLELADQNHLAYSGQPVTARLNLFKSAPAYTDLYLVYRSGETTYESDFYNQFMSLPMQMIEDQMQAWLQGSPLFKFVLPPANAAISDFTIDGRLLELYADYRDTKNPKAVLKLQLTVNDSKPQIPVVAFQKIYSQAIPMKAVSANALVEGWNKALEQVVNDFEQDFKTSVMEQGTQKI